VSLFTIFSQDVGIDLGTANTLVWVREKGIVLNEPSIVAIDRNTRQILAIGNEAKQMLGRTPGEIEAIRPLKDGVIADFEVTEDMLRTFIRRVVRSRFLLRPRIVISVPSGINKVEKRAVRDTAEGAGGREVFLLYEPMAAAIGVGLPIEEPLGSMVIDIGGGTSEIAVIALGGIVTQTSIRIAGDEMDEAIISYLKRKYNLFVGERTAERIKMTIGSGFPLQEETSMEVKGRDLVAGIPRTMLITSEEIREALNEPINQILEATQRTLEETPPELAADILDRGIVLTGGGSMLAGLDERIRQETNLPVTRAEDPLTCVVRGAGVVLEHIVKYEKVLMGRGD
jgi:rod shape-determining protein MreB